MKSGRKVLSSFFHEKAKGDLIKSRISSVRDIDDSIPFFFHLQDHNLMTNLKYHDGSLTIDSVEMKGMAIQLNTNLFSAEDCVSESVNNILERLLELTEAQ